MGYLGDKVANGDHFVRVAWWETMTKMMKSAYFWPDFHFWRPMKCFLVKRMQKHKRWGVNFRGHFPRHLYMVFGMWLFTWRSSLEGVLHIFEHVPQIRMLGLFRQFFSWRFLENFLPKGLSHFEHENFALAAIFCFILRRFVVFNSSK